MSETEVQDLAIDMLEPHPDNPRRRVVTTGPAWKGFVDSVKEEGVLVPILATPNGGQKLLVVAGHRRLAAAKEADLGRVPVIVRDMSHEQVLTAMLIENLQREDLDPVEEASGYFRLIELGMNQATLAKKVGVSAKTVASRIRLLDLPARPLAALKKGELTLAGADALTSVADDPDVLAAAFENRSLDRDPEWAVEQAKTEVKNRREYDDQLAKLKEKHGTSGVFTEREELPKEAKIVTDMGFEHPGRHASQPCHVVLIASGFSGRASVTAFCLDPRRHTKTGESDMKRVKPPPTEAQLAERERNRIAKEAKEALMVQMTTAAKRPSAAIKEFSLWAFMDTMRADDGKVVCRLLDIEVAKPEKGSFEYYAHTNAVTSFAMESNANLVRATCALALARGEASGYGALVERFAAVRESF